MGPCQLSLHLGMYPTSVRPQKKNYLIPIFTFAASLVSVSTYNTRPVSNQFSLIQIHSDVDADL